MSVAWRHPDPTVDVFVEAGVDRKEQVWACCYKPYFHSWPTQRHKMKARQLVCGHSLSEITHEQAGRTRAFAQISHRVCKPTANSTLHSVNHLHIFTQALTPPRDIPASKLDSPILIYFAGHDNHWSAKERSHFLVLHWRLHNPTCNVKELLHYCTRREHQSLSILLARLITIVTSCLNHHMYLL